MTVRQFALSLVALTALPFSASATIIFATPNVELDTPTITYQANGIQDDRIHAWAERTAYDNDVEFTVEGGESISIGKRVDSYYFYYNPASTSSITASFAFSSNILGVVVYSAGLANSDHFRVAPAPYAAGNPAFASRGFGTQDDSYVISPDGKTLTVSLNAGNPGDQFRVITLSDILHTPEPTTLGLVGGACIALALLGRRRKTAK